jgi:DNA-directed RNA polymerase alpha subunit
MDKTGMLFGSYERVTSSGVVFGQKLPERAESKTPSRHNRILLCFIKEEMEISIRSQNCLDNAGITLIGELVQKSGPELLALKNFGRTSLKEIEDALSEMGLSMNMTLDFPPWNGDGKRDE